MHDYIDTNNIFQKCMRAGGYIIPLQYPLNIRTYKNVFNHGFSLYGENQQIISESSFYRGVPDYNLLNASVTTNIHPRRIKNILVHDLYFWLGVVHQHFGHFMVSSLSRLWALKSQPKKIKIAYLGESPDHLFKVPHIAYIFNQLGIKKHQLKNITETTLFKQIVIAERSFNENHSISYMYKKTLERIYPSLSNNSLQKEYIYISKSRLLRGVRSIENEYQLCDYLTSKGIKCIFPEQLSFIDQLKLWQTNQNFVGFSSSAFHMAAMFGNKNIIMINDSYGASSNHMLGDMVANNNTLNIYSPQMIHKGKTDNFSSVTQISDIEKFGDSIIEVIDKFRQQTIKAQLSPAKLFSVSNRVFKNEPLGENISRLGIPTQISIYDRDEGKNVTPEGAISGNLTGSYQCHTKTENNPWWQIEYKDLYLFTELRIYNRLESDTVKNRSNLLSILVSSDGINFTEVHSKKDQDISFGGLNGDPYRLLPINNIVGRFIRIQIIGQTFLHFDQVEVFGEKI